MHCQACASDFCPCCVRWHVIEVTRARGTRGHEEVQTPPPPPQQTAPPAEPMDDEESPCDADDEEPTEDAELSLEEYMAPLIEYLEEQELTPKQAVKKLQLCGRKGRGRDKKKRKRRGEQEEGAEGEDGEEDGEEGEEEGEGEEEEEEEEEEQQAAPPPPPSPEDAAAPDFDAGYDSDTIVHEPAEEVSYSLDRNAHEEVRWRVKDCVDVITGNDDLAPQVIDGIMMHADIDTGRGGIRDRARRYGGLRQEAIRRHSTTV